MPRGARILLDNACYHIINRGNQKQAIFLEENDYKDFLRLLKHFKNKHGFKLFGYCLMPNHIHLIMQPKESKDLSEIIKVLTQTYTLSFKKKYNKPGHLWQGRFKSKIVMKDNYFLECVYYVEMNPVRARLVSSPAEYLWSSYRERVLVTDAYLIDLPDCT